MNDVGMRQGGSRGPITSAHPSPTIPTASHHNHDSAKKLDTVGIEPTTFHTLKECETKIIPLDQVPGHLLI